MNHLHWLVYAYDGRTQHPMQGEQLTGVISVELICESEDEALRRARELVSGKVFYELRTVVEHEEHL